MIVKAATIFRGKLYTGWRHCVIMKDICRDLGIRRIRDSKMGFVTDKGEFVDRRRAAEIAITCGQIDKLSFQKYDLFSEEMWDKDGILKKNKQFVSRKENAGSIIEHDNSRTSTWRTDR